jgi:cellulose synthase/poly-beta-1,6-N-acetylglucosamine synthase-like glycosyltransferase
MIFFWIFVGSAFLITLYCLNQFYLLILSLKNNKITVPQFSELPKIAIQLPVYNEINVIERLVHSIIQLDYPKELLEIQILDDSNDGTREISEQLTSYYRSNGWNIQHLTRKSREGYKAGALERGLEFVESEFVVIFDADFIPPRDFLKTTIGFFQNPEIGVVQTIWGHLNENFSVLTKVQAFQLNVHFQVEQKGRFLGNHFTQFNGTAGIWRKKAILDSGGWQKDTLTEDLDLSIRAQLNGWKIIQFSDFETPAELPIKWKDFKNQQFRWIKGGAECWRKLVKKVLTSHWSISNKIQAIFQLSGSLVYILILVMAISSLGLLNVSPISTLYFYFFQLGWLALFFVYAIPWIQKRGLKIEFFKRYTLFILFTMGISLSNASAAIQGLFKRPSAFVRTPKYGLKPLALNNRIQASYIELFFSLVFIAAFIFGLISENYIFLLMHFFLSIGFLISFIFSIHPRHS